MARKRRRKTRRRKQTGFPIEVIGIMIIFLSLFSIGQFGALGIFSANVLRTIVGDTYIILAGLLTFLGLYVIFKGKFPKLINRIIVGLMLIYLSGLIFMHWDHFGGLVNVDVSIIYLTWQRITHEFSLNVTNLPLGGGLIGAALFQVTHMLFGIPGTIFVIATLIFVGVMTIGNFSYGRLLDNIRSVLVAMANWFSAKANQIQEKSKERKKEQSKTKKLKSTRKPKSANQEDEEDHYQPAIQAKEQSEQLGQSELQIESVYDSNIQGASDHNSTLQSTSEQSSDSNQKTDKDDSSEVVDFEIGEEENEDYSLPPLSLLNKVKAQDQSDEFSLIEQNVKKLEDTFQSFGVNAKVVKANLGPAVTKYEIQPATGVKVSKIVSLSNDIALALAAKDIRMEAPIPGKAVIGIEVPNSNVSMVSFREIIEGSPRQKGKLLEVPIGRDIAGNIQIADLSKMPHLLIAGATGSGKSVGINGIISSILLKAKPNEVKLMMIDPKMVELNIYNGIPHLLTPVVTNPKKAAQALNKVVQEMERRYELFAASGTRNMSGYNEFVHQKNQMSDEALLPLPYIVVIVDELADLMMVASNEVENAITRLAQMARAAGIHMILATQRPSVDVITGVVKANIPSRMAFAVSSGTDSRTILDSNGAEKLLGRGDMLFLPMGANKATRVQGAFISDEEVNNIVEFVKTQQEANYVEEMIPQEASQDSQGEPEDEYYKDAVEMVIEMQTASISLLQRRFRIGYNRAARIVDEMEIRGVVGPHEGSKPREVLMETLPWETEENSISEDDNNFV